FDLDALAIAKEQGVTNGRMAVMKAVAEVLHLRHVLAFAESHSPGILEIINDVAGTFTGRLRPMARGVHGAFEVDAVPPHLVQRGRLRVVCRPERGRERKGDHAWVPVEHRAENPRRVTAFARGWQLLALLQWHAGAEQDGKCSDREDCTNERPWFHLRLRLSGTCAVTGSQNRMVAPMRSCLPALGKPTAS